MELLYVWIEGFNGGLMKEQGFNFDSRFKYQLHPRGDGTYRLSIKDNPNYLDDFFKPEYPQSESIAVINNITAIVGQNGSGKSSIVDFLKESFGGNDEDEEMDEREENIRYLYILRKYKDSKLENYIYISPNMKIDISVNKEMNFFYELRIDNVGLPRNIDNTSLIYFSNVNDKKVEYSSKKLLNISTNYFSGRGFQRYNSATIGDYKLNEIGRQIYFVYGVHNNETSFVLPFKLPEYIDVVVHGIRRRTNSLFETHRDYPLLKSIKSIYMSTRNMHKENIEKFKLPDNIKDKQVIVLFTRAVLGHLTDEIRRKSVRDKLEKFNIELFEDGIGSNYNNDFIRLIRGLRRLARLIKDSNEEFLRLNKMLRALATFMMNFYKDYRHTLTAEAVTMDEIKITFKIEELKKDERLGEVLKLYEDLCINNELFTFSWRAMSSGEKALLNIYSSFYYISNRQDILNQPEEDLIILIDEGEVYLHPHWQGNLLNSLIEFLPNIFKNKKGLRQRNIQIILTSNSPFLVSDLPSANIIFLRKEQTQTIVMEDLEEYHRTFAANIHSLLAHSFFMEDGVTGAFAKRKINEIIHMLINEDIVTIFENEEKIEKTINLIGEPVIRNKLLQMLAERRMVGVNKEIARLNLRLKKLEKWQDDKN
ncbi:AAA family ATPase [Bacillus thuringiensis]|uniref:AAA family ATPase n=1 Tax=Bacillus thuringiensis TaxID=1428 RepID=UPI0005A3438B|nr:AAA family ATPase [Bacillus thuringiensis]AJH81803.1 ABC transporter family protein [Bacillus thuringiensis]QKI17590.1 AAA family ATPase [Bacillus thuringiensis]